MANIKTVLLQVWVSMQDFNYSSRRTETASWLSFPNCFTGTINKVTSISLHRMKTFLPQLLQDHKERKEKNGKHCKLEGNEVKT